MDSSTDKMHNRHHPRTSLVDGSDSIIVFVHGYVGGPAQFDDMIEAFNTMGFSAIAPLLPGHGVSIADFAVRNRYDWKMYVNEALRGLPDYRRIILAGQSIGGLLVLNASLDSGREVDRIVLMGTPLFTDILQPGSMAKRLSILAGLHGRGPLHRYWDGLSLNPVALLYPPFWFHQFMEPKKLMEETRARLSEIHTPTLIIHSKRDETADYRSAAIFDRELVNAPHERLDLKDSFHAWNTNQERKQMIDTMARFLT